jgi:hypothetical protein
MGFGVGGPGPPGCLENAQGDARGSPIDNILFYANYQRLIQLKVELVDCQ